MLGRDSGFRSIHKRSSYFNLIYLFVLLGLISGLDSLEGSRTPGLQALPAIAGLEVTHAEGKTMGDVSGHEHPSHRGVGGC